MQNELHEFQDSIVDAINTLFANSEADFETVEIAIEYFERMATQLKTHLNKNAVYNETLL